MSEIPDRKAQGQPPEEPKSLEKAPKKPGLLKQSRDFLQTAADVVSGKELPRLVEDFTRDMVVIAEGLSADQESQRQALLLQGEGQDKLSERLREMEKKLNDISRKVDALSAGAEKRKKGEAGLTRVLRQATWLAAVIGGAWVITTLVRAFIK